MKTRVSAKKTGAAHQKRRIYIAGKVTGLSESESYIKFYNQEQRLIREGYEVVNPIKVVNDVNCDWKTAMRKCIAAMLTCEAIYCLPCWPQSRGAILERYIAGHVGIKIIDAEN